MDPLCAQYPIPVNNAIFVIGYLGVFLLFYVCVQFVSKRKTFVCSDWRAL